MPAVSWFEQPGKRTGGRAEDGTVTLGHTYTVVFDQAAGAGVPQAVDKVAEAFGAWYSPHPDYPRAILKTFTAQSLVESPLHYEVTANYDSKRMDARPSAAPTAALPNTPSNPSPAQSNNEPATARPPKFVISKRDNMEAVWKDRYGYPIKNSAGDPIEGAEVNKPLLLVNVTWFSIGVTLAHVASFWETINNAAWQGFPARTLKVEDFTFTDTFDVVPGGYGLVREVNLVLAYKKGHVDQDTNEVWGWRARFLDAGKRELVAGKLVEIKEEKTGQPLSEPYPLNGSGGRWVPGQPFNYIEPILLEEKSFAGLII